MGTITSRQNDNGRALTAIMPAACDSFADQLRRAVAAKVTDKRLEAILETQLKKAEEGDLKATEFIMKLCGYGQQPTNLTQTNYYKVYGSKHRKGKRAKTPLSQRIRQYLRQHGPKKPATLAIDLDATAEEIEKSLNDRPEWFRRGLSGVEAV